MDHGRRPTHNRKRRYRDDDDFDRRGKRRHYEEPPHVKLRRSLLGLAANTPKSVDNEVEQISTLINDSTEDTQLGSTFISAVLQIVVEQPMKIPFLAAVIQSVNVRQDELIQKLLEITCVTLNESMSRGAWRDVKLYLRLLASVQRLLLGEGIFPILNELFSRAADLQTASDVDGLGLELVKVILLTVAYGMKTAPESHQDRALAILEKTEIIASAPHPLQSLVNPFIYNGDEDKPICHTFIGLLQRQIQAESLSGWRLQCLPNLEPPSEAGNKHVLPSLTVPSSLSSEEIPRLPEVFISVYSSQDIETVPSETDSASLIIRDALVDTINILDFNRNAAARAMIDLDCYFADGLFAKRATPFDKLREQEPGKSTWKSEDIALDAIFSQLATLPMPQHKSVYYHSLLTEACKIAPAAIAPSLGRAIRFFYANLEVLDLEVAYRFNDWFAHHLSNFGYTWKWTEWIADLELPSSHPKRAFIAGCLDKEVRLSFSQRIRGTLPEPYLPLIPESKDKDIPDYKYNSDEVPFSQHAREILRLIRQKGLDADIQESLNAVEREAAEQLSLDPLTTATDIFVTCICFAGAKSLSHVLNCIERCKERLLLIAGNGSAAKSQIIDSVMDYWRDKPGIGVNIIDKLLNYTILTPMSVFEWVFITNLKKDDILSKLHIYELVIGTANKVARRIRQIVSAQKQANLTTQQLESLDQALQAETHQFNQLFTTLEDSLRSLSSDPKENSELQDTTSRENENLIIWSRRWMKCATRKLAIEQAWISETKAESNDSNQMS